jgi:hypothetical protein
MTTSPQHPTAGPSASTATALRQALEAKDQAAYTALFAPGIRFLGPTEGDQFVGRELVGGILGVVLGIFEDFHYVDQVDGDDVHVLHFTLRIGGHDAEGVDVVRVGPDGLVSEFRVMIRPLAALTALAAEAAIRIEAAFPDAPE